MTDEEWDSANDPMAMIQFIAEFERSEWVGRKLRLFAAACCRLVWNQLHDWRSREAVELAERVAIAPVSPSRFAVARRAADEVWAAWDYWWSERRAYRGYWIAPPAFTEEELLCARAASATVDETGPIRAASRTIEALDRLLAPMVAAELLREIIGNPYRRPPAWLWYSTDVRALARTIEAERSFERLPILGDALMDAGFEDDEMTRHCQSGSLHVLGCWALDIALCRD
jgi:hypothetical protein